MPFSSSAWLDDVPSVLAVPLRVPAEHLNLHRSSGVCRHETKKMELCSKHENATTILTLIAALQSPDLKALETLIYKMPFSYAAQSGNVLEKLTVTSASLESESLGSKTVGFQRLQSRKIITSLPPNCKLLLLLRSHFSHVRLCDTIDGSPPGFSRSIRHLIFFQSLTLTFKTKQLGNNYHIMRPNMVEKRRQMNTAN
ncbi:hypothetical protein AB1E18_005266 [Capra hircus]